MQCLRNFYYSLKWHYFICCAPSFCLCVSHTVLKPLWYFTSFWTSWHGKLIVYFIFFFCSFFFFFFFFYTVDSRYLDPSYLDPITYVELISKSRLFSLCIYCISASRMSNYFYVDTSAISSIIFSPWIYFSQFLLPRISNSDHDEGKKT